MKIFDWVHRKFANKEGLAESGKKSCVIEGDGETVDNFNALNVFDGWKQGILTIGTLGYDPLKHEMEQQADDKENESDAQICSDSEESESESESNPLVYAHNSCEEFLEIKRDEGDDEELALELEFNAMIKKERITLAELFSADSEKQQQQHVNGKGEVISMKEYKSNYKHGFSFAKKLSGVGVDKDGRPIHKLHRLMRMMLKRKIHPDEGLNSTNITTTQTASLLP